MFFRHNAPNFSPHRTGSRHRKCISTLSAGRNTFKRRSSLCRKPGDRPCPFRSRFAYLARPKNWRLNRSPIWQRRMQFRERTSAKGPTGPSRNLTMNPCRMLILDDDPMIGTLMHIIAEASGATACLTTEPADFSKALTDWLPTHVCTALDMPTMDGLQVLAELAARGCVAQIIISSGVGERVFARSLGSSSLVSELHHCCQAAGLPTNRLVLELTETAAMDNPVLALELFGLPARAGLPAFHRRRRHGLLLDGATGAAAVLGGEGRPSLRGDGSALRRIAGGHPFDPRSGSQPGPKRGGQRRRGCGGHALSACRGVRGAPRPWATPSAGRCRLRICRHGYSAEYPEALRRKAPAVKLVRQERKKAGSKFLPPRLVLVGARDRIRTGDLRITNALLYQLSYTGLISNICKCRLCAEQPWIIPHTDKPLDTATHAAALAPHTPA